jgi:hypothetical protein
MNLRTLTSVFVLVITSLCCVAAASSQTLSYQTEAVFDYGTFNGHDVQLVLMPKENKMLLRVVLPNAGALSPRNTDEALDYLKREVLRITSTTRQIPLDHNGNSFVWEGGHPLWAPYSQVSPDVSFMCLAFGRNGKFLPHKIQAGGFPSSGYYNGYKEWHPDTR